MHSQISAQVGRLAWLRDILASTDIISLLMYEKPDYFLDLLYATCLAYFLARYTHSRSTLQQRRGTPWYCDRTYCRTGRRAKHLDDFISSMKGEYETHCKGRGVKWEPCVVRNLSIKIERGFKL